MSLAHNELLEPQIILQDSDLLVIDKPSGWVVNQADSTKNLNVVQNWLKKNFEYAIVNSHEMRSGIVHRLDKDTSGVLLIAKTKEAFENLQKQFKERKVQKTYQALVHGKVDQERGEINAPTGRLPWNRKKFGVLPGGKEAQTGFLVIKRLQKEGEEYTLLELYPKTGRTHQIRVHLKHLGHPIVSDKTYVGRKTWRHDIKWCPRLFLHAQKIIVSGTNYKQKKFVSGLPQNLKDILNKFT